MCIRVIHRRCLTALAVFVLSAAAFVTVSDPDPAYRQTWTQWLYGQLSSMLNRVGF